MKVSFDPNLLNELLDLAHNPPGGDPVLGAFYTSIVDMVEKDHPIAKIFMDVKSQRPDITYKHLTYLIFRAYQAVKFKRHDLSYRNLKSVSKWEKELSTVYSNKSEYLRSLLNTKSVTTTIYQRYIGPFALISFLWNKKEVSIADLGCGGNYGLRGLELREPFKPFKDLTAKQLITKFILQPINLSKGLAVDKENPDEEEVRAWRIACSFYPQELDNLEAIKKFENRIMRSKKVEFIKTDLLKLNQLPKKSFDIVILSTTLYQLNLSQQLTILTRAKQLLQPNGYIIVQDFAVKSLARPTHLDFSESWFRRKFSYRTFITGKATSWKFLEVLQWNNGRCEIVRAGKDFKKVFSERA